MNASFVDLARPAAVLITPVMPEPGGSGRALRAWDWLCELARDHSVYVVVSGPMPADSLPEQVHSIAGAVVHIPAGLTHPKRWSRLVGSLMPALSLVSTRFVTDWHQVVDTAWLSELANLVGQQQVKRIVVFRAYMHGLGMATLRRFPRAAIELDMDDLESSTRFSLAKCQLRLSAWRSAFEQFSSFVQYGLLQRRVAMPYDKVWLAAPEDVQRFRVGKSVSVGSRPNRLTDPAVGCVADETYSEPHTLLFVGGLDYAPNQQAVIYLMDEICPRLQRCFKKPWVVRVVGRRAPNWLVCRMQACASLLYLSDEASLLPHYAQSQVVVVPVFYGGGTKFKTIEALAYARAVVTTPEGARGLDLMHQKHCLVAQTPEQFIHAIVQLLDDPNMAKRLAKSGHEHYQENFRLAYQA